MGYIIILPEQRQPNPAAYEAAILADSPTLFFKMDDAGVPLVDEIVCETGTTQSGIFTYQDTGKFGDAITSASAGAYLQGTGGFGCKNPVTTISWEAIIKRSGAPATASEYFYSYRINGSWGVQQSTGNLTFRFVRSTGGGPRQDIISPFNVCDGAWHHVVCTVNGAAWNLYVDGAQYSDTGLNQINTSSAGLWHWFTTADNFTSPIQTPGTIESFNGSMSSFVAWTNTELTPVQVANHYAAYLLI